MNIKREEGEREIKKGKRVAMRKKRNNREKGRE